MRLLYNYRLLSLLCAVALCLTATNVKAQPASANVLYADHPLPVRIGVEVGLTNSPFQTTTGTTYFPTQYPYGALQDTEHSQFPSIRGAVGLHLGITADFAICRTWGILAKINYNERRSTWLGTVNTSADTGTGNFSVPLTNNMVLTQRYLSVELMARCSFPSLRWLYLAGGIAMSDLLSNNYTITQTLGGPQNVSFINRSTGNGTGIRSYSLTNSSSGTYNSILGEAKLLGGFPIRIGHRWTLNPEFSVAYPFTQLFNSASQAAYQQAGLKAPNLLTFAAILGLRYEL